LREDYTSSISGNSSTGNGGGIYIEYCSDTSAITSSTIAENTAASGGGICLNEGSLAVQDSTLSGNTASQGAGIFNGNDTTTALKYLPRFITMGTRTPCLPKLSPPRPAR